MAWRQLPDGSFFNPETGDLQGISPERESAARAHSRYSSKVVPTKRMNPIPPLPVQEVVQLPPVNGATSNVIFPDQNLLAVNPFAMGMGALPDTVKRAAVVAGILGIAFFSSKLFK